MPKVDIDLLDKATMNTVGGMFYVSSRYEDRVKWGRLRELSGLTKGQWKRIQYSWNRDMICNGFNTNELTYKKLVVMAEHGKSPHLETLLKMVEAREAGDEVVA